MTTIQIVMISFLIAVGAVGLLGLIYNSILLLKNDNTYKNYMIILNAIHDYNTYQIKNNITDAHLVSYSDMEKYEKTLHRIWDWGYTRILPHDKFMLIRPFIEENE